MICPELRFFIWVFHKKVHITQGDLEGKALIVSWVTQKARGSNLVLYWKEHSNKMLKAHGKSKTYKFYNYTSGHIHHCTLRNLEVHHHHFTIFSFVMYLTLWFSSCSMTPSTTIWDVWDKQNASSGSSLLLNLVLTFPTRLVSLVIVS